MTATPASSITLSPMDSPPQKSKSKVEHYFWIVDVDFAQSIGVDVRSICGKVWDQSRGIDTPVKSSLLGTLPEVHDCGLCIRALNAVLRKERARFHKEWKALGGSTGEAGGS